VQKFSLTQSVMLFIVFLYQTT